MNKADPVALSEWFIKTDILSKEIWILIGKFPAGKFPTAMEPIYKWDGSQIILGMEIKSVFNHPILLW